MGHIFIAVYLTALDVISDNLQKHYIAFAVEVEMKDQCSLGEK